MKETDIEALIDKVITEKYTGVRKKAPGGKRKNSGRLKGVKVANVYGKMITLRCPEVLKDEFRQRINDWKAQRLKEYYESLEAAN